MNIPRDPQEPEDEPIAGEPLIATPVANTESPQSVDRVETIDHTETRPDSALPVTPEHEQHIAGSNRQGDEDSEQDGGSKVKAAALLAGAAALANKVRHEAPKKVRAARERRAAGRCVILSEADGGYLAIGPYKNEEAARQDIFKVGGTAHVIELRSGQAFFTSSS